VRLVVVSAIGQRGPLFNDSVFYLQAANSLAHGKGYAPFGFPTAEWPPGYSALLAPLFKVFGYHEFYAQVLNAILGALTVTLLYLLARRLFGRPAAIASSAALAVLPGPILWADVVVAETFYTFLLVGVLLLFAVLPKGRWWVPLVLGLAIGLTTLVRGEALLLVPAAAMLLWVSLRGPRRPVRWVASVAALVVVFGLTLLPWALRNTAQMGQFVPLSTNSSTTLYSGHNPRANGAQSYAGPEIEAQIKTSGSQRELDEAKLLRSDAVHYARTHPSRELQLIPLKLLNLFRGDGYSLEWVNAGPANDKPIPPSLVVPVRVVADAGFYAMVGAAFLAIALGGRRLWRSPTMKAVAVLLGCALVLFGFVYYGNYRYREPLSPVFLLLAGPLLARMWQWRGRLVPDLPDVDEPVDGESQPGASGADEPATVETTRSAQVEPVSS
jgi:4-amino-4-deoxy-L-arabinose transferase-like glycosyltransferase